MWDRHTEKQKKTKGTKRAKYFLDKGRKVITEVVKNSYKGSFIKKVYFLFFW